jgi:hypothetical protein
MGVGCSVRKAISYPARMCIKCPRGCVVVNACRDILFRKKVEPRDRLPFPFSCRSRDAALVGHSREAMRRIRLPPQRSACAAARRLIAERPWRIAGHFRGRITCRVRRRLGQWLGRFKGRIARWIVDRFVGRITFGWSDRIVERLRRTSRRRGHSGSRVSQIS